MYAIRSYYGRSEARQELRDYFEIDHRYVTLAALTRYQYASMLVDRARAEDRSRADTLMTAAMESAQSLGMRGLARAFRIFL